MFDYKVTRIYQDYTSIIQKGGFVIFATYLSSSGTIMLGTASACHKLLSEVTECFLD
jgi:hypothetical protein